METGYLEFPFVSLRVQIGNIIPNLDNRANRDAIAREEPEIRVSGVREFVSEVKTIKGGVSKGSRRAREVSLRVKIYEGKEAGGGRKDRRKERGLRRGQMRPLRVSNKHLPALEAET